MENREKHHKTRLAVIGSGLAGFAASLVAIKRGISTTQVGDTGSIAYTTGYFDLLGSPDGQLVIDIKKSLNILRRLEPRHILSRIEHQEIETAFTEFTDAISTRGLNYTKPGRHNHLALLPAGGVKPTCSVPMTMIRGIEARQSGARTLIVDISGLQGFSAQEFVANLQPDWPALSSGHLVFPQMESGAQVFAEVMARALEVPITQEQFAQRLIAIKGDAEAIGLPAIMGIHEPDRVHARLSDLVGASLFEIPTIPPAVPGIRLREMFEQKLPEEGLVLVPHQKVRQMDLTEDGVTLHLKDSFGNVTVFAEAAVLATGRFLSGGLLAERGMIREPLLNIPVTQPKMRDEWYREEYFDERGHLINRTGIEVDDELHPIGSDGEIVHKRLFAAGTILAHQDWIRQRCGAGIAIASAYKAMQFVAEFLDAE